MLWASLVGAVHLQLDAAEGLEERERAALLAETSALVGSITGDPPNGDRLTRIGIRARRVSWRIQVSLERREGSLVTGREELDLTRDPRSWRAPLADALRRLLPEGRELASGRAAAPAPVRAATPGPRPQPVLAVDPAPAAQPPPPGPVLSAAPPADDDDGPRFRFVPLLAIAAGVGGVVAGVSFVGDASSAIANSPNTLDRDAIEAQQRAVLENAVLGSVLLSAGVAAAVTGLVLLISD